MKKRKDGLYASQVYLGTENGKRKYKTVYGKTQKEVKEKVAELKLKLGKGIDVAAADEPFSLWAERFIKGKEAEGVGYNYIVNLKSFSTHLTPIYNIELSKITIADIQSIIDTLALFHGGKKPMSKRTLNGIKQFVGQVFKMAIGSRVVDYNPANYVKIPRRASETHRSAITEEQQRWIRDTPHRAQAAAMLMLYSGARKGEALALTWNDVDFEESTISITKAVEYIGNRPTVKLPKTKAGVRDVDVPDVLIEYLVQLRKSSNHTLIIHSNDGAHFKRSSWYYVWEEYMNEMLNKYESVESGRFTPHQLRHTFCTMLYASGYSLLEARDQMGHKDIQTTANIYTHLDKLNGRKTKGRLTQYLCKCDASNEDEKRTVQRE